MSKIALITGATAGFGTAICRTLIQAGYFVIGTGRRTERLTSLKAELGEKFLPLAFDISDRLATEEAIKSLSTQWENIDLLVNNAGLALGLAPYQDYEELDMLTMLDTNVKGLMVVTRCFLPSIVTANQGHIINMGSTAGIYAYAGAAVYSATKAAVKTFSDGLRIDTIATDIKVTTIQPGIVETDFSKVRFHGDEERAATVYQGLEALQAQDIADAVVYVTSQPRRVQITDMTIMANQQATGFTIHRD